MKRTVVLVSVLAVAGLGVKMSWPTGLFAQAGRYPQQHTRSGEPWVPAEFRARNPGPTYTVHPATQDPAVKVTPEMLNRWEKELSNWNRWGPKDTRGALNLITPEKTRQAAGLVRDGVTVSLQHFVEWQPTYDGWRFWPSEHWMTAVNR